MGAFSAITEKERVKMKLEVDQGNMQDTSLTLKLLLGSLYWKTAKAMNILVFASLAEFFWQLSESLLQLYWS